MGDMTQLKPNTFMSCLLSSQGKKNTVDEDSVIVEAIFTENLA